MYIVDSNISIVWHKIQIKAWLDIRLVSNCPEKKVFVWLNLNYFLWLHDGSCGDLSVTYIHAYAYLDHNFLQ